MSDHAPKHQNLLLDTVLERLNYNPATGVFRWKVRAAYNVPKGSVAGTIEAHGYVSIGIDGSAYYAHRLAWLYMTGEWPKQILDHRNRVKTDNRWENLRETTNSGNQQNRIRPASTNKTGFFGAIKHGRSYQSKIIVDGQRIYLGSFQNAEAAHNAYMSAKRKYHQFSDL